MWKNGQNFVLGALKFILSLQQQYWTKSLHFFFSWFSIDLYWMIEVSLDSLIKQ